jgi:hypothetical protein
MGTIRVVECIGDLASTDWTHRGAVKPVFYTIVLISSERKFLDNGAPKELGTVFYQRQLPQLRYSTTAFTG